MTVPNATGLSITTDAGAFVAYDDGGAGPPVLFLHAGIADRRTWDEQISAFSERFRVIRCDLPGYGASRLPATGPFAMRTTIATLLETLDAPRAIVIGCSFGARVALELVVDRPELVRALVLVCPGVPGYEWSAGIEEAEQAIERALDRGDLDAAAEVDVRVWVDGPYRTAGQVDSDVRHRALAMARRVYEVMTTEPELQLSPIPLDPPLDQRLGSIAVPSLIITGALDQPDIGEIADQLRAQIQGARHVVMPGVAHLPNMEQPDAFNEIVLDFLDKAETGDSGEAG